MVATANYKQFFTELIRKHMIIFGPTIAREIASNVAGLTVDSTGEVPEITGEPILILENLIKEYQRLSTHVTILNVTMLFEKYPDIKQEYNQPLQGVKLTCVLNEHHS